MRTLATAALCLSLLTACSGDSSESTPGNEPAEQLEKHGPAEIFGSRLSRGVELVPFDDLVATPEAFEGRTMQTEGVVRMNCQKRGCWMEVRSPSDAASPGITVRFVDYAFFIPLDSRGTIVRVEGGIAIDELSKGEVDDLISEGHDPGIVREDGTARVVTFTAAGVEMWNRNE
jgi:hypothetical protein